MCTTIETKRNSPFQTYTYVSSWDHFIIFFISVNKSHWHQVEV